GNERLELRVDEPTLCELHIEHLLPWRRFGDAETGQQTKERKRIIRSRTLRQSEHRAHVECRARLQDAVAEMFTVALLLRGGEEGVAQGFDGAPVARLRCGASRAAARSCISRTTARRRRRSAASPTTCLHH